MAKRRLDKATILACILVGLGVFLVVAAIMLPTYTKSKALKTPLDLHVETTAAGKASILDAQSLQAGHPDVAHDVNIESVRNVTVQDPSNEDIITIQAGNRLLRTDKKAPEGDEPTASDPRLINATVDKVTLDRKTSEPINDPDHPNGVWTDAGGQMQPVPRKGLQYKFPFDAQKKSYPYFDLTSRTTHPIDFVGDGEIDGMTVYHYSQTLDPIDLSQTVGGQQDSLTIPASALGLTGAQVAQITGGQEGDEQGSDQEGDEQGSDEQQGDEQGSDAGEAEVDVHRFYTNERDLWVDPVTGVIVKGREQINQYFAPGADSDARITALAVSPKTGLTFDDDTIQYQIDQARDGQDEIRLVTFILPLAAGIVGAALLLAGLILGFMRAGKNGGKNRDEPSTELDDPTAPPSY